MLGWRHGVGRLRRTLARPIWEWGTLGGENVSQQFPFRLDALPPTKRGREHRIETTCHGYYVIQFTRPETMKRASHLTTVNCA